MSLHTFWTSQADVTKPELITSHPPFPPLCGSKWPRHPSCHQARNLSVACLLPPNPSPGPSIHSVTSASLASTLAHQPNPGHWSLAGITGPLASVLLHSTESLPPPTEMPVPRALGPRLPVRGQQARLPGSTGPSPLPSQPTSPPLPGGGGGGLGLARPCAGSQPSGPRSS